MIVPLDIGENFVFYLESVRNDRFFSPYPISIFRPFLEEPILIPSILSIRRSNVYRRVSRYQKTLSRNVLLYKM